MYGRAISRIARLVACIHPPLNLLLITAGSSIADASFTGIYVGYRGLTCTFGAGLTVDDSGNVYIPDNIGNRTLVVPNGMTTTTANSAAALQVTNPGLNGPNSLTFGGGRLVGTNTQDGSLFFITCRSFCGHVVRVASLPPSSICCLIGAIATLLQAFQLLVRKRNKKVP